jgi:phosphate transport system substrate-binding protein
VVLTREPGDSTVGVLEREIPGFADAFADGQRARRWVTFFTDQEMARALAKTAHAIGFSDTGALVSERLPIKSLRVNGAAPTAENVRAGRYPLVKTLAFIFRNDRLAPDARAFIDFARSSEGARVLAAHGYLPGS